MRFISEYGMIKISVNEKVCREWADFLQKEEGILKQYKRKLTVLGIIISLAVLVCGCGENSPKPEESEPSSVVSQTQVFTCLGTWEITGAQQDGLGVDLESVLEELGGNMKLTLQKDGTVYARIKNASMDGTWSQNENQITVIISNGETVELEAVDETLQMEWGKITLIFEKTA